MKRFLSMLCATLIVLSLASFSAFAEGMKIVATDVSATPNGEFAIDINIENNVGIWGTALDLSFDTDKFAVKEIRNSGKIFASGEMIIGPSDFSQGFVRVFANNNALSNKTENGTLVSVIFVCKKDTPLNDYEFTLSHRNSDPANTCNIDEQTVDVTLVSATVSVVDKKELPPISTQKGEDLFADKGEIIAYAVDGGTINSAAVDNDVVTTTSGTSGDKGDQVVENKDTNSGAQSGQTEEQSEDDGLVKPYWADMDWSSAVLYLIFALAALVIIALIVFFIVKFAVKK